MNFEYSKEGFLQGIELPGKNYAEGFFFHCSTTDEMVALHTICPELSELASKHHHISSLGEKVGTEVVNVGSANDMDLHIMNNSFKSPHPSKD